MYVKFAVTYDKNKKTTYAIETEDQEVIEEFIATHLRESRTIPIYESEDDLGGHVIGYAHVNESVSITFV